MHLKLTRQMLIGQTVRDEGFVFEAEGSYAEAMVKAGCAVPVPAPAEDATHDPHEHAPTEKATSDPHDHARAEKATRK
jgi:hypothetical protein